ncbi:unnamed protein product [Tilletia laevis]|nr:unnamed protein product [Tilletia laevis]CAD6983880.1 unnamed protein product [Tilletia controversa]
MAANEGECADLQADELTALASILPEDQFEQLGRARVQLKIPISFDRPRKVRIISSAPPLPQNPRGTATSAAQGVQQGATDARLEAPWLPSSSSSDAPSSTSATWIRARLAQMWEESRAEVLWLWADWVREGLWEEIGGGGGGGGGGEGEEEGCSWWPPWVSTSEREEEDCIDLFEGSCSSSSTTPPLSDILRAHNSSAETSAFEYATFYCSICLDDHKGRRCTRLLGCGHVFCSDCLTDYVRVAIDEGLTEISCPDPECTKNSNSNRVDSEKEEEEEKKRIVSDSELLLLVGQELFGRFAAMRKKTIAEADPTAAYCPVVGCGAVVLGRKEDEGTSFEALRECEQCGFAFCRWCGKAW